MHNLHLLVIRAPSAKQAMVDAENEIANYGDENNWRSICGCVSEKDKVTLSGDGRDWLDKDCDTIAKINRMVRGWMNGQGVCDGREAFDRIVNFVQHGHPPKDSLDFYRARRFVEHLEAGSDTTPAHKFNVLKDGFKEWDLSENGVTHLQTEEKGQLFVVFLDMHD